MRNADRAPWRRVVSIIFIETLECRRLLSVADFDDHEGHDHGAEEICALPPAWEVEAASSFEIELAPPFPLTDTFALHSRPGASKTIHLDFDGHTTTGTSWNSSYNSGNPIVTPAYSFEGNTSSFSNNELERIQRIWQRVVEDFAPFDVNVTTQQPPSSDLIKSGAGDTRWGVRVCIGGSYADWFKSSAGGVAYVGSFNWGSDTPCFVFEDNLSNGGEKSVAEAISHEIGHTVGLSHDGRTSPSEDYYQGHGSGATGWAPIMGVGYYRELVQWSKGEYLNANRTQDDLNIITTNNGFGYRPDDHGNTFSAATALSVGASGVIERNTDIDVFTFSFPNGGALNLTISPFYLSPNLDILAQLYNSSNVLIAASNPTEALNASLSLTLQPGAYGLFIRGTGKGDPLSTGYTNYGSLGQYSIGGAFDAAPSTPVNPSPASGATGVAREGLVLDWSDAANAISYDVYLDDMTTPKANVSVSQWTITPEIKGGPHQWKVVARNGTATASSAIWSFSVTGPPPPATPVYLSPANGSIVNTRPVTFDWQDDPNATSFDLYLNNALVAERTNLTTSEWTGLSSHFNAVYSWRVEAKNADYTIAGPTWSVTIDSTPPTASLGSPFAATGADSASFNVIYSDAPTGVNVSTIDDNDIIVTGPNGYSAAAALVSVNNTTNGSPRLATYRIPAPGGFWSDADHGAYTVTQVADQVSDVGGLSRPAETIGSFSFSNFGFAWMSGSTLNVAFDETLTPVLLGTSGSDVSVSKNGSSSNFAGVSAISILGSNADDRLQITAPLTPPINFVDSGGNDLLELLGGTYTFDADIGTPSGNLAVYVAPAATAIFNASQNLRSLSVDGVAALAAGGASSIAVTDLFVTGRLNLSDNALTWEYQNEAQVATAHALVASGRAGGEWTGDGIVTDRPEAAAPQTLKSVGIAQTPASVVFRYTFAGDANLDGTMTGDDFFAIDSGFSAQTIRWDFGDFDYNGVIDSDDYFLIDSNYSRSRA